ncbi:sigma 54-interacting transcriptional regulator [Anaerotignum sp.]
MKKRINGISSADLWNIVDHLHDEIMIYDNDYNLLYVNKAALRHYGISQEEMIGKKFSQLDETYWGNSTLPEVYQKKTMVAKRQITNLGLDIITISVPVFGENGEIKYVAQNVNDIYNYTQQGKAEEKFLNIMEEPSKKDANYIFAAQSMERIMETLHRIKNVKSPCLILGETGTGKSQLAKYIHSISDRKDKPFVAVNCACMNPNLIESELFGYKKGAFSGANAAGKKGIVEVANGGTLFLDEISEIPYDLQGKLLQFMQDQEFMPLGSEKKQKVDVKIIAATNRDLKQMVEAKSFREDLYYRLNIFEVTVPPLRERPEDIKVLIAHYLEEYNKIYFRNHVFSEEAMQVLLRYKWPGNVRELSHIVEKTVVLTNGKEIQVTDLPKSVFDYSQDSVQISYQEEEPGYAGRTLREAVEEVERKMVRDAFEAHGTSVKVAEVLGVSQPTAYRLIKKYCMS